MGVQKINQKCMILKPKNDSFDKRLRSITNPEQKEKLLGIYNEVHPYIESLIKVYGYQIYGDHIELIEDSIKKRIQSAMIIYLNGQERILYDESGFVLYGLIGSFYDLRILKYSS